MRNLLLSAAAAVLIGAIPVAVAAQPSTYDIGQGRKMLRKHCGGCHATAHGDISYHADAVPFPEVVKRYPPEHLAEALAEGIVVGHPDMPLYHFSAIQVEQIIAFLKSLE